MNSSTVFRQLHEPGRLLVLPNAWDAGSARLIEACGAAAIATSSAAMSWARGVRDGEHLRPEELIDLVGSIARAVDVPVSVDVEMGYHDEPRAIAPLLAALLELGVAGINIEDGTMPADQLARKVEVARRTADDVGVDLFINARTDVYLRSLVAPERRVEEVLLRAGRYRAAGCDGLFVPRITDAREIESLASKLAIPLNVLAVSGVPSVVELQRCGVRRLSVGQAIAQAALTAARDACVGLLENGTYDALFAGVMSFSEINQLFAGSRTES